MSVRIELSSESVAILEQMVEAGSFETIEAALEHAVLQFDEIDYTEDLLELARPALDQYARGEYVEFTREMSKQILEEAIEASERSVSSRVG